MKGEPIRRKMALNGDEGKLPLLNGNESMQIKIKERVNFASEVTRRAMTVGVVTTVALFLASCSKSILPVPSGPPPAVTFERSLAAERISLPSGLTVFLLENRELPIVSGTLTIRGGGLLDKRRGLTPVMAEQMRQGGAGELSGERLDSELQKLSAGIDASAGQESISISFSCLAGDLDRVFELFSDVVMRPRFDESRLSLWRAQALEGIRRRTDEPWTVAGISFQQLVFGNTPYGASTTSADVRAVTRSELAALHKQALTPKGSFLSVSGAVSKDKLLALMNRYLAPYSMPASGEESHAARSTVLPELSFSPKPGIYFIELPLTQASVYIGQQGVPRLTPDYPAIDLFNQIFGSGFFGSRLMKTVRTEKGLAYSIFGGISSGPVRGRAAIGFQTKTESVNDAIRASISELLKMRANPVSSDELAESKSAIANAFVFRFDSVDELVKREVTLEFLGYPSDYDETYLAKIGSVTPEDIQRVAQTRWDISKLVVLVVGNRALWEKLPQLSEFEPLANLPIKRVKFDEVLR